MVKFMDFSFSVRKSLGRQTCTNLHESVAGESIEPERSLELLWVLEIGIFTYVIFLSYFSFATVRDREQKGSGCESLGNRCTGIVF